MIVITQVCQILKPLLPTRSMKEEVENTKKKTPLDGIIIHTKKIQLAPFKSKILMNTSTLISFTKAQQQDYNLVFF